MLYLLTDGGGMCGDEWYVLGIFTTREKAAAAKQAYEAVPISAGDRSDRKIFRKLNEIEEWETDPAELKGSLPQ